MAARKPSTPSASAGSPVSAATRFLVLHGKDRFQQDRHLDALRAALVREHGEGGVDTVRFDGLQGARILADVLDECRSFGLMQTCKLVLVDNAEGLFKGEGDGDAPPAPRKGGRRSGPVAKTPREILESYASEPSDSATLVLRVGGAGGPGATAVWRPGNLDKAIAKVGAVIKCEPMSEAEAVRWIGANCQERHGAAIEPKAAAMLVNAVGTDLGRIDTELEKLALAAGDGEADQKPQAITASHVQAMVGVTREEDFWSVQMALLAGDAATPLAQLRELIEVSRHDPVPISYAFCETARKVHVAARGLAEGVPEGRVSSALRIWGQDQHAMTAAVMGTARAIGPATAARLLNAAVGVDAANKSGRGDQVRNLEIMALRFANVAARRRR